MNTQADQLHRLARAFPSKTILVVGDVILDEYVFGDARRISPEAPVPIVDFRSRRHVPGGAANVATNLIALGCRAIVAGIVGNDDEARYLCAALESAGVSASSLVRDPERPTTLKLRILAQHQQIVRLDREVRTPVTAFHEDALWGIINSAVGVVDACILSDYGKGVVTPRIVRRTISACRSAGIPVLVDPKSLDLHLCQDATIVKPNKQEAERLSRRDIHDDATFLEVGTHLAASLKGTGILITRGPSGMTLFRHDAQPFHATNTSRIIYDVTGAGDTVISLCTAALASGASPEESVWLASQAAAIAVSKLGTSTVNIAELEAYIGQTHPAVGPLDASRPTPG